MTKYRALSIVGRGVKPSEPRAKILPGQFCIECQQLKSLDKFKRYSPSYRGTRKHHRTCKECLKRLAKLKSPRGPR